MSTKTLIGIILGSVFGLVLIIALAFIIICGIHRKNKLNSHQQVKTQTATENHVEESVEGEGQEKEDM